LEDFVRAFLSIAAVLAMFVALGCEKKAEITSEPGPAPVGDTAAPAPAPAPVGDTAAPAPAPAPAADQWKEYSPEGTGFTVLMPGTPKVEQQSQPTDVGPIMMYIHMVERDNAAFLVMYSDFPAEMVKAVDADTLLDGGVNGAAQGGKLISQKKIEIDGHKGREFVAEKAEGTLQLTLKARTYLVGNRLYQAITSAVKGSEPWADIDKFLDSFKLLKK
jgi:hypothetical protein